MKIHTFTESKGVACPSVAFPLFCNSCKWTLRDGDCFNSLREASQW